MEHKDLIRDEFTRQAPAFADAPTIKDESHARMLVDAVAPRASDRVLDVACGPGHVTLAFAMVCREAVGIDLTEAPLKIAEKLRAERAIANARFQLLDADRLPFDVGEFDAVVCRFAVHHFPDP
ncbi:MAG TPA: class I SAM-dependent methyltransferase, partial [Candidatus Binataceae bacterium]|nr:class I SAM-dependent methyltransferase [Candidatus Binataceae bacterium]